MHLLGGLADWQGVMPGALTCAAGTGGQTTHWGGASATTPPGRSWQRCSRPYTPSPRALAAQLQLPYSSKPHPQPPSLRTLSRAAPALRHQRAPGRLEPQRWCLPAPPFRSPACPLPRTSAGAWAWRWSSACWASTSAVKQLERDRRHPLQVLA